MNRKTNFIMFFLLICLMAFSFAGCAKKDESHSLVEVAASAATCDTKGNVHHYKCGDCGKTFSDESGEHILNNIEVPPLGHLLIKVPAVEADCITMSNGMSEYYECVRRCSKKFMAVPEEVSGATEMSTEQGEKIFVTEKKKEELIVFAEHNYQGNVCSKCKHVENEASKGLEYELSADETYYIVSGIGTCTDKTIFIGGEYNGKPVKEVKSYAFKDVAFIEAVVSISGANHASFIEKIEKNAFENCISLKNIYLSGGSNEKSELYGIREIEVDAFKGCTDLTVTYEGSRQEWLKVANMSDMTEVNLVLKSIEIIISF